jgi:SAM-dependent methyltransferase
VSEQFDQAFWDSLYEAQPEIWSGNPNHGLVVEVDALVPGLALDVGAGEGADAIWLAGRGWRVTAVDISAVALARAASLARRAGAEVAERIDWVHRDLMDWVPPTRHYELVSAHFFHLAPGPRQILFGRLASAVAEGGTLLVVGHSSRVFTDSTHDGPAHRSEGSMMPLDYFFSGDEIAAQLDPGEWDIVTNAEVERAAANPEGPGHTHDIVLRATRRRYRSQGAT